MIFFFLIRRATLFHSQKFELEDFLVLVEEGKADELSYFVPLGTGLVAYVAIMITANTLTMYFETLSESSVRIKCGFIGNVYKITVLM